MIEVPTTPEGKRPIAPHGTAAAAGGRGGPHPPGPPTLLSRATLASACPLRWQERAGPQSPPFCPRPLRHPPRWLLALAAATLLLLLRPLLLQSPPWWPLSSPPPPQALHRCGAAVVSVATVAAVRRRHSRRGRRQRVCSARSACRRSMSWRLPPRWCCSPSASTPSARGASKRGGARPRRRRVRVLPTLVTLDNAARRVGSHAWLQQ
jgi:hypothetical protein